MPNPLILIPSDDTAVHQFLSYLSNNNDVYLLILGNTDKHKSLKEAALIEALDMRKVMQIFNPDLLMPTIYEMPKNGHFNDFNNIIAISISKHGTICGGVKKIFNISDIRIAFQLAEVND